MAAATGFSVDYSTGDIKMNRGDTGSYKVAAERASGAAWTEDDRMIYTVRNAQKDVVMQRYYRLDDAWDLGDGVVLIEYHNDDTDDWENGSYEVEMRFLVSPIWDGEAPAGRCVDALREDARMVEGGIVRTVLQSTLTIEDIYGEV